MKGKNLQQRQGGIFGPTEGRQAILLRRAQSQPGQYRQGGGRRRSEQFQLVCLQQSRSAVMEIVGGGDNRKKQADKTHQGDGGNRAAAVRGGERNLPGPQRQQR